MKFGFNFSSFPDGTSLEEMLKQVNAVGFTGFEAAIDDKGIVGLDEQGDSFKRALSIADYYNIDICSIAYRGENNGMLTDNNPQSRIKAMDTMRYMLDAANRLGADTILVFAGIVGLDDTPKRDVVPYEVAYERALEGLMRLKDYAKDAGVTIGIENWWIKFLLSPLEVRSFIDIIDSPYVRAYMDVGNILTTGYPEDWIRILGRRIAKVHIKDYRLNSYGMSGYVDLLAGDVDFPEVVKALSDIDYQDYCLAEMIPYKYYNEQQIKNTAASMKKIFGINDCIGNC